MTSVDRAPSPNAAVSDRLDRALHDIEVTRFDSRLGRLVPLALAGLVAVVAATVGASAALAASIVIAVGLVVAVVAFEGDRWRAQDVLHWYQADRTRRWRADTGSAGPSSGDPAEAEVWLGTHQRGSVPQVYRAMAAIQSRDEFVIEREMAALPDDTPHDRAWRLWVIGTRRLLAVGDADVEELREMVPALEEADDRTGIETWLATVDALRLHARGDSTWLAPLVALWPRARRVALGGRHTARLWISRLIVVPVFALSAVVLGGIGLELASGPGVPADYARTELATRGDVGEIDDRALATSLPALAHSLAVATRIEPGALGEDGASSVINDGLPTLIWDTHRISLAPPPDAADRHVWSVEVLLGGSGPRSSSAIVTFDDEDGPAYLYGIDPEVVGSIRAALSLAPPAAP